MQRLIFHANVTIVRKCIQENSDTQRITGVPCLIYLIELQICKWQTRVDSNSRLTSCNKKKTLHVFFNHAYQSTSVERLTTIRKFLFMNSSFWQRHCRHSHVFKNMANSFLFFFFSFFSLHCYCLFFPFPPCFFILFSLFFILVVVVVVLLLLLLVSSSSSSPILALLLKEKERKSGGKCGKR